MSLLQANSIVVPRKCVEITQEHLHSVGRNSLEGLALWAGASAGGQMQVKETIIPVQQGIRTPSGVLVSIDHKELHRINVYLFQQKLTILAQIHSHPSEAFHSSTDDDFAIATQAGALSIVVPDFARSPFSIDKCAVYRLNAAGRWHEVSAAAARHLIQISA